MAESYYELLRHPEWQKKRLVVMQAAGFECAHCGAKDITLNVHHRYYLKGRKPWEYPDEHLDCLCEQCHEAEHMLRDIIKVAMGKLGTCYTSTILGYLKGLLLIRGPSRGLGDQLCSVNSYEEASGLANAYRIPGFNATEQIVAALKAGGMVNHAALEEIARRQTRLAVPDYPSDDTPPEQVEGRSRFADCRM